MLNFAVAGGQLWANLAVDLSIRAIDEVEVLKDLAWAPLARWSWAIPFFVGHCLEERFSPGNIRSTGRDRLIEEFGTLHSPRVYQAHFVM